MPIYAYKCEDCGSKYEIFHKVKEVAEDVVCPDCDSANAKKMMSAASIGGFSVLSSYSEQPSCANGECGGMCGMN